MNTNTGGTAFPAYVSNGEGHLYCFSEGASLRDYFAAKAMQAILEGARGVTPENQGEVFSTIARASYAVADAMLAARSKT